jgi:hypothetical protein
MSDEKSYRLSDKTIAQIVQLIQLGILTGTDISDQMRTLRVVFGEDDHLDPCPEFVEMFDENLNKLQELASQDANQDTNQ